MQRLKQRLYELIIQKEPFKFLIDVYCNQKVENNKFSF